MRDRRKEELQESHDRLEETLRQVEQHQFGRTDRFQRHTEFVADCNAVARFERLSADRCNAAKDFNPAESAGSQGPVPPLARIQIDKRNACVLSNP